MRTTFPPTRGITRPVRRAGLAAAMLVLWACPTPSASGQYLRLGPSDNVALDQPRIAFEVYDPDTGRNLGPEYFNMMLLDTAAQGVVVVGYGYDELVQQGLRIDAIYDEQGIAGTAPFGVSAPYNIRYAGIGIDERWISDVRMLASGDYQFGSFSGIMGMPGLLGQRVTMDNTTMPTEWQLTTQFVDQIAPSAGHRYTAQLGWIDFPHSGQRHPDDPLPTYAPLPTVQVGLVHETGTAAASFILDTGAQMSLISTAKAIELGLDRNGNGVLDEDEIYGYTTVGGVGGSKVVPVVEVNELFFATDRGDVGLSDLLLIVVDIDERIEGIAGMDLLTSGWVGALFGGPDGYFQQTHLDFSGGVGSPGQLVLDVTASLDIRRSDLFGDLNRDGVVGELDLEILRNNWQASGSGAHWVTGDMNGDGVVDLADLALLARHWPTGSTLDASWAIPEPATLALLTAGALPLLKRRRR